MSFAPQVTIKGSVINEPKTTQVNNSTVLNFTVSARTTMKDKNTGYYITDLYNVNVWGKEAERLAGYLKKGNKILVTGDQRMNTFTTKAGEKVTQPVVTATHYEVLDAAPKAKAEEEEDIF